MWPDVNRIRHWACPNLKTDGIAFIQAFTYGTVEAKNTFAKVAARAAEDNQSYLLPCYALMYVWHGNTVLKKDREKMERQELHSACYSCHCLGLLFHHTEVYVCDGNGSLIPGSSCEFVSIPLKKLAVQLQSHHTSRSVTRTREV